MLLLPLSGAPALPKAGLPGLRAPVECRGLFGEHPAEEVKHTSRYRAVYAQRRLVAETPLIDSRLGSALFGTLTKKKSPTAFRVPGTIGSALGLLVAWGRNRPGMAGCPRLYLSAPAI